MIESKELTSLPQLLNDQYLDYNKSYLRLEIEYYKYNSLVVAYDFDNTVYDFHNIGATYEDVIELLRRLSALNCWLICFTANQDLNMVKTFLEENKIPFNGINVNPPFMDNSRGGKIYYNALLDDRAGLTQVYKQLTALCNKIELNNELIKEKTL